MTPAMLERIAKRKMVEQHREDLLFGILNSTVANYSFCAPEKPRQPEDFMLRPMKRSMIEPIDTAKQTAEHVRSKLVKMFGMPSEPYMIGDINASSSR